MNDYHLCCVKGQTAWFTTCPLSEQWGDDWNDAPYERNAGDPYDWQPYMQEKYRRAEYALMAINFYGKFEQPCDGHFNSPYSVQDINRGVVPWLKNERVVIAAGTTLDEFIALIEKGGGLTNQYVERLKGKIEQLETLARAYLEQSTESARHELRRALGMNVPESEPGAFRAAKGILEDKHASTIGD